MSTVLPSLRLSRREVLLGMAALALPSWAQAASTAHFISAGWRADDDWQAGEPGKATASLPARAHDVVRDPRRPDEAIVLARRPGYYLARINWRQGKLLQLRQLETDRSGFGHGVFSHDGRQFLSSENNERTGQGCIAVRDAGSLRKLAEWPSHGIGPHQLLWLDPQRLAVANGGILTLPEQGRAKLNLDQMQPSLTVLDGSSGALLAEYRLTNPKLSIRHLALNAQGQLAIAMQNEGAQPAPLLAVLDEQGLQPIDMPGDFWASCQGYAASICAQGEQFLLSFPKAGLVACWDAGGALVAKQSLPRPYGVAAYQGQWWVSSENGPLWQLSANSLDIITEQTPAGWHWDNHVQVWPA